MSFPLFFARVPFNMKTTFGYLVAWLVEFTGCGAIIASIIPFFSLFFGSSWLFVFIAEDIRKDLTAFNSNENFGEGNRAENLKHFRDIVHLYSDAKQ